MSARTQRTSLVALGLALAALAAPAAAGPAGDANPPPSAFDALRALPIQAGGRVKPVDTFAREHLYAVTGEYAPRDAKGEDPVFTVLQMALEPDAFRERPIVVVRNLELVEAFRGQQAQKTHVSVKEIEESPGFRKVTDAMDWSKEKGLTPTETAVRELVGRVHQFRQTGELLRLLPVSDDPERPWVPIGRAHEAFPDQRFAPLVAEHEALAAAYKAKDAAKLALAEEKLASRLRGYEFRTWPPESVLSLELSYNRVRPFRTAYLLFFAAAAALLAHRVMATKRTGLWVAGLTLLCAGALLHVGGTLARTYITQFAPVGSLYETGVWIAGVAVVLSVVFELMMRQGSAGLGGALLGGATLLLADRLPLLSEQAARFVDPAMNPLQPVLRSYWLNIHVTCMLTSYGALGLACMLGLDYAVAWVANGGAKGVSAKPEVAERLERLELFNYRVIQVGFFLLTLGVLLGAVWANQSWGRYWGWDPKETWAFITWLIYAAYLHFRFMGWVKGPISTVWNLAGFGCVIFTYLGVSFLLPGLHSYLDPAAMAPSKDGVPTWVKILGVVGAIGCVVAVTVLRQRMTATPKAGTPPSDPPPAA